LLRRYPPGSFPVIDDSGLPMSPEAFVWTCFGLTFAYYVIVAIALHWRPKRKAGVTQYAAPAGISPAVAAYLFENGRYERAFAAALVSLAAQGFLKIYEEGDHFALTNLNKACAASALEEAAILEALFPAPVDTYQFSSTDTGGINHVCRRFEKTITEIAEPELISRHWLLWSTGLLFSYVVVVMAIDVLPIHVGVGPSRGFLYLAVLSLLCGSCFVAALRAWPATLRKIFSFLPGTRRPTLTLNVTDAIPLCLSISALFGFGLLASATTNQMAALLIALVLLTEIFRHVFEAPTIAGRQAIEKLKGFREFLARAEADRMNRENRPGHTPETLEPDSGYAVALKVEHGWAEEFAGSLIQFLQMERAYSIPMPSIRVPAITGSDDGPIQLNINSRK
jgi:Predicted membrane protein (DUF2207)